MAKVTGIGGVFFRAEDPAALCKWYADNLGVEISDGGFSQFSWLEKGGGEGSTHWSPFSRDSDYFGSEDQQHMVNYRVDDLDGLLAALALADISQIKPMEEYSYGRFAWVEDLDGNRIELWEPVDASPE